MHAIHPSTQHGGAVDRAGNRPQPVPTTPTTTPPAGTTPVTDTVNLSPEAKAFLAGEGPGKSGNSPAHLARLAIIDNPALADMPFGKIVSGLNHGVDFSAPALSSTEPAGDIAPVDGIAPVDVDPLAATMDPTAPVIDPATDPVVEAVIPPTDPVVTEAAIPVVSPPPVDVDLVPDADDVTDPEADLLAALGDALDEADGETPDEPVGIDIAA
jgi:hypothetical protein